MIERYGMDPGAKLYFYLDGLYRETFFHYKQRDGASSSDGDFHDPRGSDGVVCSLPTHEAGAEGVIWSLSYCAHFI
jgi:hypothetical protein